LQDLKEKRDDLEKRQRADNSVFIEIAPHNPFLETQGALSKGGDNAFYLLDLEHDLVTFWGKDIVNGKDLHFRGSHPHALCYRTKYAQERVESTLRFPYFNHTQATICHTCNVKQVACRAIATKAEPLSNVVVLFQRSAGKFLNYYNCHFSIAP
jgi:hypothetical protein